MSQDILSSILSQSKKSKGGIFNYYRPKSEIGKEILSALKTRFVYADDTDAAKGFYLSDINSNSFGLLTQCQGLATLATMSKFSLNVNNLSSQKNEDVSILKEIEILLEKIFSEIYTPDGNIVFNTSPYLSGAKAKESFTKINSYVEAISKVLVAMSETREILNLLNDYGRAFELKLTLHGKIIESPINKIDETIHLCIKKLNETVIKQPEQKIDYYRIDGKIVSEEEIYKCKVKGWNFEAFTDDDSEASLYFTYLVSTAYMSLRTNMTEAIDIKRSIEKGKEYSMPEVISKKLKRDMDFYDKIYVDFRQFWINCVHAGRFVDMQISQKKIDLTASFIGLNYTSVSYSDILESTSNNAIIDTLFALGILINSGVDLDYEDFGKGEEFFEMLRYSMQNIQKAYRMLVKSNKDYIVEQYILPFSEKMDSNFIGEANSLRKEKIYGMSLVPLMVSVFTSVFQYTIKYPQKEMVNYLEYILKNRLTDEEGNYLWLWDREGFDVNINYLYVSSLSEFFSYYEEYELPFLKNSDSMAQKISDERAVFNRQLSDFERAASEKYSSLKAEYEMLEKELAITKAKKEPIISILEEITKDYLNENAESFINNYFEKIALENREAFKNNLAVNDDENASSNIMRRAFMSYFDNVLSKAHKVEDYTKEEVEKVRQNKTYAADTESYKKTEIRALKKIRMGVADILNIDMEGEN